LPHCPCELKYPKKIAKPEKDLAEYEIMNMKFNFAVPLAYGLSVLGSKFSPI
jgi:hypothetical protein